MPRILSFQRLFRLPFSTATSSLLSICSKNILILFPSFSSLIKPPTKFKSPHLFLINLSNRLRTEENLVGESMKFGKRLKQQVQETFPNWRDKFLSYKDLKKLVKLISSAPPVGILNRSLEFAKSEEEFIYLLNNEIEKFNSFFLEQEEDFIIQHKELQQRIKRVIDTTGPNGSKPSETDYNEQIARIRKDIVNFHGEMVLLINYSNVNYTGLAKILKKYDKRTGGLLRLPFIQKVLEQPFFTTDLISKLVRECEATIDLVFSASKDASEDEEVRGEREAIAVAEEGILRNTVAALMSMQEIRKGSSTYSHFSLPPLNLPESELIQSFQLNSPIPTI